MTIKISFERSSQSGGRQGLRNWVNKGPILKFDCRAKAQEKQHFGKSHFYCGRFLLGNTVTIILDNYPPSTLQGVRLGGRRIQELLSQRVIVISAPLNLAPEKVLQNPTLDVSNRAM